MAKPRTGRPSGRAAGSLHREPIMPITPHTDLSPELLSHMQRIKA
jgi:hypothetical protein